MPGQMPQPKLPLQTWQGILAFVVVLVLAALLIWAFIYFLGGKQKNAWKESLKSAFTIAFGIVIAFTFFVLLKLVILIAYPLIAQVLMIL